MTLRLMRGYPGSGKTTFARAWVNGDKENRRRVNRDDIRHMLFGKYVGVDEQAVTKAQRALVETFLRQRKDVVVDDTNLKLRNLKDWVQVAYRHAHQVEIVDVDTPLEDCLERNIERAKKGERSVDPDVIKKFAERYPMPWPDVNLPQVVEPAFKPVTTREKFGLDPAIIVDLDGTLAIHNGRSPYNYDSLYQDTISEVVNPVVEMLYANPFDGDAEFSDIIFLSGRPDSHRQQTVAWLESKGWRPEQYRLFMRKAGDDRADYVVKYEIFDREIRNKFDVRLVLDDRDQVVDMWRAIGLPTWQVARGDF
jgi:predicted kinase